MNKEDFEKQVKQFLMDWITKNPPEPDFKVTTTSTTEQLEQGILNVDIEFRRDSLLGQAYLKHLENQDGVSNS